MKIQYIDSHNKTQILQGTDTATLIEQIPNEHERAYAKTHLYGSASPFSLTNLMQDAFGWKLKDVDIEEFANGCCDHCECGEDQTAFG